MADTKVRHYHAIETGRAAKVHGVEVPVVRLPRFEDVADASGNWDDGDVIELPDGTYGYFEWDGSGFATPGFDGGIYRQMLAMDAGDNVIRRRTAPQYLDGFLRYMHGKLNKVGDKLAAVVEVDPRRS